MPIQPFARSFVAAVLWLVACVGFTTLAHAYYGRAATLTLCADQRLSGNVTL